MKQFDQQREQTRSLAGQAAASLSIAKNATAELSVAKNQLAITAVQLKIYKAQARLAALDAAQRFRQVTLDVDPISLPTEEGNVYNIKATFTNLGPNPLSVGQIFLGGGLVPDVAEFAAKEFVEADKMLATYVAPRSTLTVGPGKSSGTGNTILRVNSDHLFAIQRMGYSVVVVAAVVYRDPFGGIHHEYVCRYSMAGRLNQTCPTPPSD